MKGFRRRQVVDFARRILLERVNAAFHRQTRVISQVTCNGRSLNPWAAPEPVACRTSLPLAFLGFEVLPDNWDVVDMPRILGRAVLAGSAESHNRP